MAERAQKDNVNWIDQSALAGQLEAQTVAKLATVPTHVFARNSVLFRPGDSVVGFALVLSGRVGVYLTGAGGRDILLYDIVPGQTCVQSTLGILGDEAYSGEAICETDCTLAMLPRPLFMDLLGDSPGFRTYVFKAFSTRLNGMMSLLEQVAFVRVENRLAAALLARAQNGVVRATHAELATLIGSAREVVSRRLDALAKRGLVRLERGSVTLLDPAGLKEFSEKD